jgi:2-C-methyl-D-erythritol 4-phosphate cytidylyltransferase
LKNIGVILVAGKGERFAQDFPKQFSKLAGRRVVEYTLDVFEKSEDIDFILVVSNDLYEDLIWEIIQENKYKKIMKVISGGSSRFESTLYAIKALDNCSENDNIVFHDGVRPFVTNEIIKRCIKALKKYNAIDTAIDSSDTVIEVDSNNFIKNIPDRSFMKRGQTPQAFKYGTIKQAYEKALQEKRYNFTCDCGVVLSMLDEKVYVVYGDEKNIKITYPIDLYIAEKFIQMGVGGIDTDNVNLNDLKNKNMLIVGSSSGIGKEIFDLARNYGANVTGVTRKENVDISNKNSIEKFLKKQNKIFDIVIVTAGVLIKKPFNLLASLTRASTAKNIIMYRLPDCITEHGLHDQRQCDRTL